MKPKEKSEPFFDISQLVIPDIKKMFLDRYVSDKEIKDLIENMKQLRLNDEGMLVDFNGIRYKREVHLETIYLLFGRGSVIKMKKIRESREKLLGSNPRPNGFLPVGYREQFIKCVKPEMGNPPNYETFYVRDYDPISIIKTEFYHLGEGFTPDFDIRWL